MLLGIFILIMSAFLSLTFFKRAPNIGDAFVACFFFEAEKIKYDFKIAKNYYDLDKVDSKYTIVLLIAKINS